MKLSESVKPISYIKSHASEVIRKLAEDHSSIIITLNGEAKAVLQDIREFEKTEESLALLKILAQSKKNLEDGRVRPARESFKTLKKKTKEFSKK